MIYLLEDDENIRELVCYSLNVTGNEAEGFAAPSEFWRAVSENLPELVILDVMLPEEDGLQVLSKLRSSEKKEQQIVKDLQSKKSKYLSDKKKKQAQINALNKKIAQMITEQNKKQKGKSSPQKQVDIKLSKEFAANKGKLPWPVNGTIVGRYGKHKHPVYKNVDLPFNNGVNISTATDAQVRVVFDGVVCQVVVMPGYNQCVLVQHGEYYTFYCKLKQVKVKAGDKVSCGDVLGIVDSIGGETGLHFQLWKGTASQDPEPWLL